MNREIKFRAWDKELEYMAVDPTDYQMDYFMYMDGEMCRDGTPVDMKTYVLMQYTGLKDKNGVEIYEGDIIRYRFRTKDDNEQFTSQIFFNEYMWLTDEHSINRINEVEVIGNIYENKDLLI